MKYVFALTLSLETPPAIDDLFIVIGVDTLDAMDNLERVLCRWYWEFYGECPLVRHGNTPYFDHFDLGE